MRIKFICSSIAAILCHPLFNGAYATEGIPAAIYVVNYVESTMYRVDPITGAFALVTPTAIGIPPGSAGLDGCKIANSTLAYTLGFNDGHAYAVNLETGSSSRITSTPIGALGGPSNLALADSMTAYVVNQHDENVYSLNLLNGTHTLVTALPIPATQLSDIALMNDTAYVVAYENSDIYAVSLLNGMSSTISTTIPSSLGITGIALLNNIAYVTTVNQVGIGQGGVYTVDVTTGQASLLTPSSAFPDDAEAFDIAIVDGKIAYTAGGNDNNVYAINLATGALSLVTPVPVPGAMPNGGLFGLGVLLLPPPPPPPPPLPPMVHTLGLSGNLLIFANYLNAQAPLSTLSLFDPLSGSALTEALEASMPARLGFATFAAQNGYFASAQVVTDHLYQKRFINRKSNNSQIAAMNLSEHDLLVNASKKICSPADAKSQASCNKQGFFTGWLGSFGEYAHEKAQQQTPAFDAAVGGAVVGMDYNCINNNVIGFGGSPDFGDIFLNRLRINDPIFYSGTTRFC